MGQLLRLFLVLALMAPAVAACGDDDDDDTVAGDGDADSDSDGDADGDGDADADADADGDADCVADPCDVYDQCGCDAGQNCTFNGADKQCVPAATGQQDEACSDQGLCDIGFACLSDNTCAQYCDSTHRCAGGANCSIALGDPANPDGDPLATVCATPSNCDALAGTGCEDPNACYISNPTDGTTDCAPAGDTAAGEVCVHTNDCAPGATCIGLQGQDTLHCLAHCDATADPTTCAEGSTCQALVNGEPLGICIPNAA